MKKEYRIPKIRMVQLCDSLCLGVGSQDADPTMPAGAKKYNNFFDAMADEEEEDE